MSVLDRISNDLKGTTTHKRRWYWFDPDGFGGGKVTICLQKSLRGNRKKPPVIEEDEYQIEETADPKYPAPGREFLVLNATDPDQPDVYRTFIHRGDDESRDTCTCKAGKCKVDICKHRSALRDIIDKEGL